ncbi:MAG: threonylcarbamoyl-AMP synthase [Phycisphaeraceae bacterium]|nr:threonylcarbamoyl-AMP synthase [Phycisphaeraceae bacterium]
MTSEPHDAQLMDQAVAAIRAGRLVGMPTETVYGLAADAMNVLAVASVFEVKARPHFDPLIVHVADRSQLDTVAAEVPAPAKKLIDKAWPGPVTIVVPKTPAVPDLVTAGLSSVAVRMPDHPVALELIRRCQTPLAAPSANRFGRISPTTAEHVRAEFGSTVDVVLDGGPCRTGVESTVISFLEPTLPPVILRPGGMSREAIEATIGPVWDIDQARQSGSASRVTDSRNGGLASPGMTMRHYAPRTPLLRIDRGAEAPEGGRAGLLAFEGEPDAASRGFVAFEVLSPRGDLAEAAANLFAALRRLDGLGLELIAAEPAPPSGLGVAINDRLHRAGEEEEDEPL